MSERGVLLVTGTSGAGKSTLIASLGVYDGVLDVLSYVMPHVERDGDLDGDALREPYEDMIVGIQRWDCAWRIIEIASDWPSEFIPRIVAALDSPVMLVYCDAPLSLCLSRNDLRAQPTPAATVVRQSGHGSEFYQELARLNGLPLLIVDTWKQNVHPAALAAARRWVREG